MRLAVQPSPRRFPLPPDLVLAGPVAAWPVDEEAPEVSPCCAAPLREEPGRVVCGCCRRICEALSD